MKISKAGGTNPPEKLVIDREDPADASRKIYERAPHKIRAEFISSLYKDDCPALKRMRAAAWATPLHAVQPDGSPFKPRSADVDEIIDAMTSLCQWADWSHIEQRREAEERAA